MTTLWIAVLVLSAPPSEGSASTVSPAIPAAAQQPAPTARTGKALAKAAREALREWARPADGDADAAAREFLVIYRELKADTRLSRTERDELRGKVRSRLLRLADQITKREARLAAKKPKSVDVAKQDRVLAQWGGFGPAGGFGGWNAGGAAAGGPNNGQANQDEGQALVDLIHQVVCPTIWDVNGGPASIYYWRNQRALVVAAPGDAHEDLGYMLEQLRRAGN